MDGQAYLRFSPNTEDNLAGYRAYRATATGGLFVLGFDAPLAALSDINAPNITLSDFTTDGTWYFTVTAYNTLGQEGVAAGPVSKTIVRPATRLQIASI